MVAWLHSIRQWLEVALVVAIAIFLLFHFVLNKTPSVTLPGGQVINMDTKSFNNAVKDIQQKITDQNKKMNDLESTIRQKNTEVVTKEIPAALAEKNITVSVNTMLAAW
jgi:cell shape-determining protein MreC